MRVSFLLRVAVGIVGIIASAGTTQIIQADEAIHVARGSTWRFFPGLAEPSSPDPAAWRLVEFDDSAWASGAAPLGYGDAGLGTDLAAQPTPMRGKYSSLFLRRAFEVTDASRVVELHVRADYDDGFAAWVNGVEVLRVNAVGLPGDPVTVATLAASSHEAGAFEDFALPPAAGYLRSGVNVIAVQAFNVSLTNNDFKIDVELADPLGPDLTPPAIASLTPLPGATVRSLTQVAVVFSEDVQGVDAADLIIGGSPAKAVSGELSGPYVFTFDEPPVGRVDLAWDGSHGIHDLAVTPNSFGAGGPWSYTLDPAARDDLVLSEFVAAGGGLADEDREEEDWIEVHNRGAIAVNLAGWSLTDDAADPGKWVFPELELAPDARIVVFASGKDRRPADGRSLHTSFQLAAAGEYLGLYSSESPRRAVHEYRPAFPEQRAGHSYGIGADGAAGYFDVPTPGAPNGDSRAFPGFAADPAFTPPRGFHGEPIAVSLASATPGAKVYYTVDGSEPSPSNGAVYEGPIDIHGEPGKAVIPLRAAAYADGLLPSNVVTHTYLYSESVLAQPKQIAGFPDRWGAVEPADYEMDPRVIGATDATDRALRALRTLPAISISLPVADFLDPARGIYTHGNLSGPAWERAASAEIIYPTGEKRDLQVDCGLRIQGGSSTDNFKSKKYSLRLVFRGDYGASKLHHRLFDDSPVDTFDTVVLDAHLNLAWTHPDHAQRVRAQYTRDIFVSDLQNLMGQTGPHGRFMNVFVDGVFWGVYDVHERPDNSFGAEYFGGSKDEYDCIRHGDAAEADIAVSGDSRGWRQVVAAARAVGSSLDRYAALGALVDYENLIDYMLANFYVGNDDWPRHNWYISRRRAEGERWRFFSWDAEHVLKDVNINVIAAASGSGISPAEVFTPLRQNAEFRLLVADRIQRHFFGGGALYVDPANEAWDPEHPERNRPAAAYMKRIAEIDDAIVLESARWGDARRPELPYTRDVEWIAELNLLTRTYFPARSRIVLGHLRSAGLYPRTAAPVFHQQGGRVESGFELAMSLPEGQTGTIYFTLDGSDPRFFGSGGVHPSAAVYAAPLVMTETTIVKARTLDAAGWSALNEAVFSVPGAAEGLEVSEFLYHPRDGESEFIELVNSGQTTLDLSGMRFTRGIDFVFAAGTALPPGARAVIVSDTAAFRARHPDVESMGSWVGSLDNSGEDVALEDASGREVIAFAYGDDDGWPVGADRLGHSLVLVAPGADPRHPLSWRASAFPGGSPGRSDSEPRHGGIRVSEVLARSTPPAEDAIELWNPTGRDIDAGGWFLSDSRDSAADLKKHRIADGTVIAAGGYAVVLESSFNAHPGEPGSFALGGGGEAVYLSAATAEGELTGYVTGGRFDGSDPAVTLGIVETTTGVDLAPLAAPTLGSPNADPRVGDVVINEVQYHPEDDADEFIELHNLTSSPIALFDAAQTRGWRLAGVQGLVEGGAFELGEGASIAAGGYLLITRDDPESFRSRRGIAAEVPIAGPFGGTLDNGGERLRLQRPAGIDADGETVFALVDAVRYDDRAPWPTETDGGGPSLERRMAGAYGNDAMNWGASREKGGTPGAPNSVSADGNAPPVAKFTAAPAAGVAPMTVSFDGSDTSDPDGDAIELEWSFGDGGVTKGPKAEHTYVVGGVFTARLVARDAKGAYGTRAMAIAVEVGDRGGFQLPGDLDQDGRLGITDAIDLLRRLFRGDQSVLPCAGGTLADAPNRALLDASGDARVNVTDAVHVLMYLFAGGPPHVLGPSCVPIVGCPEACGG